MLEGAKVTTSKFLQLRDELDKELRDNENLLGANNHASEVLNIHSLQKSFGKLCELLHELTIEDTNAI